MLDVGCFFSQPEAGEGCWDSIVRRKFKVLFIFCARGVLTRAHH